MAGGLGTRRGSELGAELGGGVAAILGGMVRGQHEWGIGCGDRSKEILE
jgi:hypothetical protein